MNVFSFFIEVLPVCTLVIVAFPFYQITARVHCLITRAETRYYHCGMAYSLCKTSQLALHHLLFDVLIKIEGPLDQKIDGSLDQWIDQ